MGSLRNVTTSGSDQKWEVMIVLKLSLVSGRRTFFGRGNEIHYIGGTEILPAPLDTAEEQKMIHMCGRSDFDWYDRSDQSDQYI